MDLYKKSIIVDWGGGLTPRKAGAISIFNKIGKFLCGFSQNFNSQWNCNADSKWTMLFARSLGKSLKLDKNFQHFVVLP